MFLFQLDVLTEVSSTMEETWVSALKNTFTKEERDELEALMDMLGCTTKCDIFERACTVLGDEAVLKIQADVKGIIHNRLSRTSLVA